MNEGSNKNIPNQTKGIRTSTNSVTKEKIAAVKKKSAQIVENLLEPSVSEELLIDFCNFISQDDYLDVVEERNIILLCGYPLCPNAVKLIKQKYHISLKSNKVFDITERKCFCSNICYKASNFLKAQLCASPIWLKEKDAETKIISLLTTTKNSGSAGEEIDFGFSRMTTNDIDWVPDKGNEDLPDDAQSCVSKDLEACIDEFEKLEVSEQQSDFLNLNCLERTFLTSDGKDQDDGTGSFLKSGDCISVISEEYVECRNSVDTAVKQNACLDSDDDDFDEFSEKHEKYESLISGKMCMPIIPKTKVRKALLIEPTSNPDGPLKLSVTTEQKNNHLETIQKALLVWISVDTFHLILGDTKFESLKSEILENMKTSARELQSNSTEKLKTMKESYTKICLKLEKEEAVELKDDHSNGNAEKDPCYDNIDVEQVCRSKEDLEQLKVTMFYEGKIGLPENTPAANKKRSVKKSKPAAVKNVKSGSSAKLPIRTKKLEPVTPSSSRSYNVLPVVESLSQNVIRKKIVADHLKIVYMNILPLVGLYYRDISEDCCKLISTFSLSSTSVCFKPPEWKMIAVVLFRMIEKKLTTQKVWNQEKCWELLEAKLGSFDISLDEIDTLIATVTDHSRLKELLLGY